MMTAKRTSADWCQSCGFEKTRSLCEVCGRYVCHGCSPMVRRRSCPKGTCQIIMQQRYPKRSI